MERGTLTGELSPLCSNNDQETSKENQAWLCNILLSQLPMPFQWTNWHPFLNDCTAVVGFGVGALVGIAVGMGFVVAVGLTELACATWATVAVGVGVEVLVVECEAPAALIATPHTPQSMSMPRMIRQPIPACAFFDLA
jgi:hypothetical protein